VPEIESVGDGVVATGDGERAVLSSDVPLEPSADGRGARNGGARCRRDALAGAGLRRGNPLEPSRHRETLAETVDYWRSWVHDCDETDCLVGGQWHDLAVRSSLVLKLLIHRETGAVCAAPTTSLPEDVGGVRNWDYRFNWIRDSAFTVRVLAELGHLEEARSYFELCLDHCSRHEPAEMPPVYGLHGESDLEERRRALDHLEGYCGSAPVRVGNAAQNQHQLDIYGELVLALYESVRYGEPMRSDDWTVVCDLVDYVSEGWDEPDAGIWEMRTDHEGFVYSKVMCWTALDRGIRLAEAANGVEAPIKRWRAARDDVREAILEHGFSEGRTASCEPSATTTRSTRRTCLSRSSASSRPTTIACGDDRCDDRPAGDRRRPRPPVRGRGRAPRRGQPVPRLLVLARHRARARGRTEEARDRFESVLEYASPLGLLAEAVDPESGEQRGNYPQAYSHIGLLNSALSLADSNGSSDVGSSAAASPAPWAVTSRSRTSPRAERSSAERTTPSERYR